MFDDSMTVFNGWSDSKGSVLPIYKKLIAAAGLRIWVYRYVDANLYRVSYEQLD